MDCQTTSDEKTITDAKVVNRRRALYLLGWGFMGVFGIGSIIYLSIYDPEIASLTFLTNLS